MEMFTFRQDGDTWRWSALDGSYSYVGAGHTGKRRWTVQRGGCPRPDVPDPKILLIMRPHDDIAPRAESFSLSQSEAINLAADLIACVRMPTTFNYEELEDTNESK